VTLTVGSLFSGIGGIDLGLQRAGMTVKWHSEIDPYACRVLKKHWPDVPNLGNIKEIDWATVEPVDVIAGGYPCQPFSTAGKRQGDKDERHLWPYFLRAISELRPRFALLENVRGHLSMGFDRVLGDLAEIGYDAEWQIVSAASVGAPHRRDRIICVAYPNCCDPSDGRERENVSGQGAGWRHDGSGSASDIGQVSLGSPRQIAEDVADSDIWQIGRRHRWHATNRGQVFGRRHHDGRTQSYEGWQWWEVEPDVGRVADGIPARVDRLRGLGNAVVPQVAEYVGRMIMASL
jgi:DNA (cytosine-5)-methyltransferase 1